jgi:VanZ family protein
MFNFISKYSKLLFFTWLILIFIASSLPQLPTPKIKISAGTSFRLDYLIHFLEFFILSILFIFWMINNNPKQKLQNWIIFIAIGIGFAFMIEFYQDIIPGRKFNIVDSIYNSIGIVSGILFLYMFKKILRIVIKK